MMNRPGAARIVQLQILAVLGAHLIGDLGCPLTLYFPTWYV